jgi:prenyltransferase beta subunit
MKNFEQYLKKCKTELVFTPHFHKVYKTNIKCIFFKITVKCIFFSQNLHYVNDQLCLLTRKTNRYKKKKKSTAVVMFTEP